MTASSASVAQPEMNPASARYARSASRFQCCTAPNRSASASPGWKVGSIHSWARLTPAGGCFWPSQSYAVPLHPLTKGSMISRHKVFGGWSASRKDGIARAVLPDSRRASLHCGKVLLQLR
jgi:hypothetical protein